MRYAMFKDANPGPFAGIYVVCGYSDLRYGIDSLAVIIEKRYQKSPFVPNTLFLFCGRSASKIKGLLWEGDGFLLLYKQGETSWFLLYANVMQIFIIHLSSPSGITTFICCIIYLQSSF